MITVDLYHYESWEKDWIEKMNSMVDSGDEITFHYPDTWCQEYLNDVKSYLAELGLKDSERIIFEPFRDLCILRVY